MGNVIKVLYICYFSNQKVRKLAKRKIPAIYKLLRRDATLPFDSDFAQWNTNAISELVKHTDIELHIVCPVSFLAKKRIDVYDDSVYYHFIRDERSSLIYKLRKVFFKGQKVSYKYNRRRINDVIRLVGPDIIHIIGAENDYYADVVFDITRQIPVIVQLQTLINSPEFKSGYLFDEVSYNQACCSEAAILARADYIGTTISGYRKTIVEKIKTDANFLSTSLAIAPMICKDIVPKKYDCIYFASNIEKSADLAVEAFVRAKHKLPNITMLIVGGYSDEYKKYLLGILSENGVSDSVTFLGRLQSYSEVLSYVQRSRCALLPLKVDFIASTIREAMALGVPTLSTITSGTPILNETRQSILLSEIGDHEQLSINLVDLLTDSALYVALQQNAYQTIEDKYSNKAIIDKWVDSYKYILD